jgi:hypothetical protein
MYSDRHKSMVLVSIRAMSHSPCTRKVTGCDGVQNLATVMVQRFEG